MRSDVWVSTVIIDPYALTNVGTTNQLYRNLRVTPSSGALLFYLTIRCIGAATPTSTVADLVSNKAAIGARVRVVATINGNQSRLVQEVSGQTGRGGQSSLDLVFGLGTTTQIESIVVEWPSGKVSDTTDIKLVKPPFRSYNRLLVVTEDGPMKFAFPVATEESDPLPERFALFVNYPNPFTHRTNIRFALPQPAEVTLTVYDLLGREIETVRQGLFPAGEHQVSWQAGDFASGIYFYRLQAGDFVKTHKMLLVR